jgi:SNF2 family DNA or RNA helicase
MTDPPSPMRTASSTPRQRRGSSVSSRSSEPSRSSSPCRYAPSDNDLAAAIANKQGQLDRLLETPPAARSLLQRTNIRNLEQTVEELQGGAPSAAGPAAATIVNAPRARIPPLADSDSDNEEESYEDLLAKATNMEEFGGKKSVEDAAEALGLEELTQPIPGMTVPLLPYQILGVAWMIEREQDRKCCGGLVADEMGLGKTIQTIALMEHSKSLMNQDEDGPTLIFGPLALMEQWDDEIGTRTDSGVIRGIHHGSYVKLTPKQMQKCDVVITTYGILNNEWIDYENSHKTQKKPRSKVKKEDSFVIPDSDEETKKPKGYNRDRKPSTCCEYFPGGGYRRFLLTKLGFLFLLCRFSLSWPAVPSQGES